MTDMTLGDKKPSQLLREMRELAVGNAKDDIIHSLWLQRLPDNIKPMLAMSENLDLNTLAEMADRIIESTNSS